MNTRQTCGKREKVNELGFSDKREAAFRTYLDGWNSKPYTWLKRRRSNFFVPLELLNVETTLLMTGWGISAGGVERGFDVPPPPLSPPAGGAVCKIFLFLGIRACVSCPACSSGLFAIVLAIGGEGGVKYFFFKKSTINYNVSLLM